MFTPKSTSRRKSKMDFADSVLQGKESVIEKVDNIVIEPVID